MIRELKLNSDFENTIKRFEAWWQGEIHDRPPITIGVPSDRQPEWPAEKRWNSLREKWLDVEYNVQRLIARVEAGGHYADAVPVIHPNVGPELTGTAFGCELEFSERTSWSIPTVHDLDDWQRYVDAAPNFDNEYWRCIEQATDMLIERCDGRYIVGLPDLHGNYDILSALREPELLCMDMADDPALITKVGRNLRRAYIEGFERMYAKLSAAGFGSSTWTPMYHEGPAYVPNCDFWCMVSGEMAREMILPDIRAEMAAVERNLFHLDGPNAHRHLDMLLDLPELDAMQWVYGDGNGPAARWIDTYAHIKERGKSLQLLAAGPEDALAVLERIGTRGVWVCAGGVGSVEEADAFIDEVARLPAR